MCLFVFIISHTKLERGTTFRSRSFTIGLSSNTTDKQASLHRPFQYLIGYTLQTQSHIVHYVMNYDTRRLARHASGTADCTSLGTPPCSVPWLHLLWVMERNTVVFQVKFNPLYNFLILLTPRVQLCTLADARPFLSMRRIGAGQRLLMQRACCRLVNVVQGYRQCSTLYTDSVDAASQFKSLCQELPSRLVDFTLGCSFLHVGVAV